MYKYDKEELKKELTLEQVYDLLTELGAEPILKDNCIICKTICHNSDLSEASHKLYYYQNTHLFHCYTGCGDSSFDIYELVLKVNKNAGIQNFTLFKAISFVAKYFGYTTETFNFEEDANLIEDWKLINNFKRNQEKPEKPIIELREYDKKVLNFLPCPHITDWEKENISFNIIQQRGIRYNPVSQGIVIPHYNINNQLIGIRERTLIKENEIYGKYRPAIINGIMYNHPLGYNLYNINNSKKTISIFKKAIIFQGQKSCLKYASYFGEDNDISVACCGSNLINYQIHLLLSLGVQEVIIAFDKQFQAIGDIEWQKWTIKLKTIYNKYGNYFNISYLFDKYNLLNYKDSPIDKTSDIFLQLYKNRIFL